MRRSKLESCEAILEALVSKPLTFEHLACDASLHCTVLDKYLGFLIKNELVEERPLAKKTLYAITERGMAVLRALNFQKYLEKIQNTIRTIDEAREIIPDIFEDDPDFKERTDE